MNISDRTFTYPVLSIEKDDYKTSVFNATLNRRIDSVNAMFLEMSFTLQCPEIQQLIDAGKAEFVMHLECSITAYRTTYRSNSPYISCHLPISKVNGRLEIMALIVTKEEVKNFHSSDFVEDFENFNFDLDKFSIIAYENMPILEFTKNYEEFNKSDSIFQVYKRVSDDEIPMKVEMNAPKIKIGLGQQQYSMFLNLANKPSLQSIFHSIVVFPALVYVFGELRIEGMVETYHLCEWYISLAKSYEQRGIKLEDELDSEDKSTIELAQEAMNLPVNKAFGQITFLANTGEEEE